MNKELTFNDLPMVVAQLRDEVVGMKQMIISLQSQNKPHKANTHIPMSVVLLDTIPVPQEKMIDKFTVLPVAPTFAEAIARIYNDKPFTPAFG